MKVVKLISTKSWNSLDEAILAKKNSSFQFEWKSGKLIDVNIKFSSWFPSGYTIASSMKTYPNKWKLIEALVPIMKSLWFNENVTSNDSEQIVTKDIWFSKSDEFDSIPDKTIEVKKITHPLFILFNVSG